MCFDIQTLPMISYMFMQDILEIQLKDLVVNFSEKVQLIEGVEDNVPVIDEELDPMELVPNLTVNLREDIVRLIKDGFEVDDDN